MRNVSESFRGVVASQDWHSHGALRGRGEPLGYREALAPAGSAEGSAETTAEPSGEEVATTQGSRYYPPQPDAELTLTVEAIGLYDVPVIDEASEEVLEQGVIHIPQTPMPWEKRQQKNVYLAGHRLGFPNTGSRLVFYNLDKLSNGDTVILKDHSGTAYEYRVSESFVVESDADWMVDPERARGMVTLQTCTFPNFENRLIVHANRV
jgi:sortase A